QLAHLGAEQLQFLGREAREQPRRVLFGEQHHQHRGALGIGSGGQFGVHCASSCLRRSPSMRRSASSASSGFSRTIRCASSICAASRSRSLPISTSGIIDRRPPPSWIAPPFSPLSSPSAPVSALPFLRPLTALTNGR